MRAALLLLLAFPALGDVVKINDAPRTCVVTSSETADTYTCAKVVTPPGPPSVTCKPTPSYAIPFGPFKGSGQPLRYPTLKQGQIGYVSMPVPLATTGYVSVSQAPNTPVNAQLEMWFSYCPGDVNDRLRLQPQTNKYGVTKYPCVQDANAQGGTVNWNEPSGSINQCELTEGATYFFNWRHVKIGGNENSCTNPAGCANVVQENITTP